MMALISASVAMAEPLVYEGTEGVGVGTHIVLLAGDHEYRSEETIPALARILARHHGFKCTVLFTVDPQSGEIDPASDHMPGTNVLDSADLMVIFLRFKNFPKEQMQPIVGYLERGGPVVGLRTSTHAFNMPKDSEFARFAYNYRGDDFDKGFGRQILGETWAGHYGENHKMSTRLDIVPEVRSHPILRGVSKPWVQSGGYWTEPMPDSRVLALAQPLNGMTADSAAARPSARIGIPISISFLSVSYQSISSYQFLRIMAPALADSGPRPVLEFLSVSVSSQLSVGTGREGGRYSLEFFSQDRNVCVAT
ncbi:MAG: hypothetical protein O3B95_13065 [Chloroflexi bacterium]|nr:hypothetical protein [Chloroflexota bacterium]